MSLSARDKRILAEIEDDLETAEPVLADALDNMRRPRRYRVITRRLARYHARRTRFSGYGWLLLMVGGLLAGIGALSAGLVLDVPLLIIPGVVLVQLAPVTVAWLARFGRRGSRGGNGARKQRA